VGAPPPPPDGDDDHRLLQTSSLKNSMLRFSKSRCAPTTSTCTRPS
jgi:hypothetical protein